MVKYRVSLGDEDIVIDVPSLKVTCACGRSKIVDVPRPRVLREKPRGISQEVTCLSCGHVWTYAGALKRRVRCPICHSAQNDLNRKKFGDWTPENLTKVTKEGQKNV